MRPAHFKVSGILYGGTSKPTPVVAIGVQVIFTLFLQTGNVHFKTNVATS